MSCLFLRPDFKSSLGEAASFDQILHIEGEVYRQVEERRTSHFLLGGKSYFIKAHFGVGWKEIFKNLLSLRLPVLGARNEVRAVKRLQNLGLATLSLAAYGWTGWNPARQRSFVVTDDLVNTITLEDYCRDWGTHAPNPAHKWRLIQRVAEISRRMHSNGVNHRDFYLCHFLFNAEVDESPLYLIDLHRVQLRSHTPRRWVVKDVGGLYFSAMEIGLTRRDLYRFMRAYRQRPLREILRDEADFWRSVEQRAQAFYLTRPQ